MSPIYGDGGGFLPGAAAEKHRHAFGQFLDHAAVHAAAARRIVAASIHEYEVLPAATEVEGFEELTFRVVPL